MNKPGLWLSLSLAAILLTSGCAPATSDTNGSLQGLTSQSTSDWTSVEADAFDKNTAPDPDYVMEALSWETPDAPFRREWSLYLQEIISNQWSSLLEGAADMNKFCPRYYDLNRDQKANVWAGLFAAVSKFESSYKPTTRMVESTMGTDPVTGSQVVSEGLLQLSYQDGQWAKWCQFNWQADKKLAANDPRKTILHPLINLNCGVGIMARQITKYNKISVSKGVYWSVLRDGSKKVSLIAKMVQEIPFCTSAE